MPVSRTYRCLNCMDSAVTRDYDVSHVSRTCEACGEFGWFVNERVLEQFEAFEASPPEAVAWETLEREQKLLIAEGVARRGRSVDEFAVDDGGDETDEPDAGESTD